MNQIFITFLASFLIWFMFAGLLILWLFKKNIRSQHVVHAVLVSFIAFGISQIIKAIFPSLRPFQTMGTIPLTLTTPIDPAFPSSHSSAAFALAMSVQRYDRRAGFVFVVSAIMVSMGRVLSNVHYYIDIFGGAIIGILSVFIFEKIYEKGLLNLRKH